jgi:hypothetical protein
MSESLGEALPKEMARIRDVMIPRYMEIGDAGKFALMFMRQNLDAATKALAEGDVIAMIRAYEELKSWTD